MTYAKLKNIKKKYFGYEEIARTLGISGASARVEANRFVKYGFLVRAKRNLYLLRDTWENMEPEGKFAIANLLVVPSYVSLMTALSYYQITTLVQRDFIESISTTRTKYVNVAGIEFNYMRMNKALYSGFMKVNDFFIAEPEKAFVDAAYLASLKRYSFDITSIDRDKLDRAKIEKLSGKFPAVTRRFLTNHGYIKKT